MSRVLRLLILILVVVLLGVAVGSSGVPAAAYAYDGGVAGGPITDVRAEADPAEQPPLATATGPTIAKYSYDDRSNVAPAAARLVGHRSASRAVRGVDDLLGASDDIVVLGRQGDTAVAQNWPGHVVLDTPNWSQQLNDDFITGAIAQRRTVYIASPLEGNLVQTSGRFAGEPTIFARELQQLADAGYRRVDDYMVPPP